VTDTKLLPNGNILTVRGRPFGDKIMEIAPATNEIVWTYAEVPAHHDADLLPDGTIMFLYRTVVSDPVWGEMIVDGIRIVDRAKNVLWDWNLYEHDPVGNPVPEDRFYSHIMSDADRLPNGNVLVTSATEGGSIFDIF